MERWDPASSYWCPNCKMAVKVHNDAELKRCRRLVDQKPGRKSHHATSDRASDSGAHIDGSNG